MSVPIELALKRQTLCSEIEQLEHDAHDFGLTIVAHALNNAKNAWGWEVAGNIERAGKAARGER